MQRQTSNFSTTSSYVLNQLEEQEQQEEEDYQLALRLSRQEYKARANLSKATASSSRVQNGKDLNTLDREIEDAKAQRDQLDALIRSLEQDREKLLREIRDAQNTHLSASKGKQKAGSIDYTSEFEWSEALRAKMKAVFGFDNFRLCQEGICNASVDGRDIVGIMPTGGGKSLGYQLPALMVSGCTLVISPLLSLIQDQILHLHEAGVDAVMLTGATSREESQHIYRRLQDMASGANNAPDIKLCYVTILVLQPEKIAKSKTFTSALEKLYRVNKLARFVVDEAHCVSQQGHDFRPDYQKLSALRQLFPKVPILALSATCPPAVLRDLLKTLRMPAPISGSAATTEGTILFSAPLYRKNLHYTVVPKPASAQDSIRIMCDYILKHHPDDTGIVYCLTKKDAENVAEALHEESGHKILTGVYHADVPDMKKENLHRDWRKGKIKVVCATIAFGLGIDKGDVRYVLHHTLSKSLDGFYQESGRAGRDGKDADCVLYYRPQDATRIASITCGEHNGEEKVLAMLRFASDLEECRKIQFAKYFSDTSHLSLDAWDVEDGDALARCGHCDNCIRPPELLDRRDVRLPAWQLLRLASRQQATMAQLCDLARGSRTAGAASSGAKGRGRGRGKGRAEKAPVDIQEVAGGKVELTKEQTEALCVRLLVEGYLEMSFSPTAYAVNVYLKPSDKAARLTRFTRDEIEKGKGIEFYCSFLKKESKRKGANAGAGTNTKKADKPEKTKSVPRVAESAPGNSSNARGKRKRDASELSESVGDDEDEDEEDEDLDSLRDFIAPESDEDEDEEEWEMDWSNTMRGSRRTSGPSAKRPRKSHVQTVNNPSRTSPDVIELSSD